MTLLLSRKLQLGLLPHGQYLAGSLSESSQVRSPAAAERIEK